jgi:hypothetical protein
MDVLRIAFALASDASLTKTPGCGQQGAAIMIANLSDGITIMPLAMMACENTDGSGIVCARG